MFNPKIRTTAVTILAALSIGVASASVAPASAEARVKASPTGDSQLDDYCRKVADLVDHAVNQANHYASIGDADEASQWHALAEYMLRGATQRGCNFYAARFTGRLPTPRPTVMAQP
jgi:hypothetical protein